MAASKISIQDLVERGYSRRFVNAYVDLLGVEGEFVDDPVDRGGATKYGISLRFLKSAGKIDLDGDGFADFDLDFDGDIDAQDIRKLTVLDAAELYERCFWKVLRCENMPRPIGEMMFDQGVNGGNVAARKLLQRALNKVVAEHHFRQTPLVVDGVVGFRTQRYLDGFIARGLLADIVKAYRQAAADRYVAIVRRDARQQRFLKGWLRRAEQLGRHAEG
ncbi:hypothetical protein D2V17_14310 [Aurantiacibacter xanthus]|uniref:Uncharacterized protein n=1 Tax=Aurantiacibacter xanthus TaxID=1784712 RepID=A0A3A1P6K7_9SPHN|nr:glycosyl hydrolase 108 family protein [Aurantiacibacter xanthus]RIV82971.1 hypothetical protein D2V17_14310 [Aurantiacibacter xanthus]